MVELFEHLAAIDEQLLAVPFGSELEAARLLSLRGQLVATLESAQVPAECAAALLQLRNSTAALENHFSHFRRRLAAEIGESGSHRQFLETLADSLEPAALSGKILA